MVSIGVVRQLRYLLIGRVGVANLYHSAGKEQELESEIFEPVSPMEYSYRD